MGTMQRDNRVRREIEGKAEIRVLTRPFRQLTKAINALSASIERLPPEMRTAVLDGLPRLHQLEAIDRNACRQEISFPHITSGEDAARIAFRNFDRAWYGDRGVDPLIATEGQSHEID